MAAHIRMPTRSRDPRFRRVIVLLTVPFVATSLLTGARSWEASQAAAAAVGSTPIGPTNAPPAQGSLEVDEPTTVTLITGDKVTVYPDGSVETNPGPSREHVTFDKRNLGAAIRVVPSDAAQLLADGRLDERLFDLTYLISEGYDDAHRRVMPLIVQGALTRVHEVAAGPGAKIKRQLPTLRMSMVAQNKTEDIGRLWSRMTGDREMPVSLASGVVKIWLDGMAHVTLDESVPQIGAPQAWDAGYTGEGVKVAVLDTGIDSTHPDLSGQVIANEVFSQSQDSGRLAVEQLDNPIDYLRLTGAQAVPKEGLSEPLVYVGRACVDTQGDQLLADPAGKVALIVRDQTACPFAEKYDAAVEAGATGVVIYNDDAGMFKGSLDGAAHWNATWGASISDTDGAALVDLLEADHEVALGFTNQPLEGDLHGHGTHVAATIAGTGAASEGLRKGVAPDAELLNGKVCNESGACQDSWVIAGMEWAAANQADIVNMSLGSGPTDGTDPMSQAVNTLTEEHGVLFVVAAGNAGVSGPGFVTSPGAADAALTVGAVDKRDQLASFSSRGPRLPDHVAKPELTAPGVGIVSARAASTSMGTPIDDRYTSSNGTSMATPHVAGAAALLAQARPSLHPSSLKDVLASTTVDTGYLWYEQGSGRIDIGRAVTQRVHADASVNFGNLVGQDPRVQREVTYTNETDRVIRLQLEAAITNAVGTEQSNALTLSVKRLTVRPHRAATVTVVVDHDAIASGAGSYGGVISATAVSGASLRTTVGFGVQPAAAPLGDNWDEDWVRAYRYADGEWPGFVNGMGLKDGAISPDGQQIFLTGVQSDGGVGAKIATAAIDAVTGEEIWVANEPVSNVAINPRSAGLAVSPDGSKVFVSQDIWDADLRRRDILTIAYNTAPPEQAGDPVVGEQLWRATYHDVGGFQGTGSIGSQGIAATLDGERVLVTGSDMVGGQTPEDREIFLLAYDTATGEQEWLSHHHSPGILDNGSDIAIDPAGELAYVTGFQQHVPGSVPVRPITIAYVIRGESAGEERWTARHDSTTGNYGSWHNSVSEDGRRVFVVNTVDNLGSDGPFDSRMLTHAYDAATGELQWSTQFGGADHGYASGHTEPSRRANGAIAVSPDNDLIFVSGLHCEGGTCQGRKAMVTVAYNQETGDVVWSQLHEAQGAGSNDSTDFAKAPVVSPDGARVYVSGTWGPRGAKVQVTLAYDAHTGEQIAVGRVALIDDGDQFGERTFVRPDGSAIYTVGSVFPGDQFSYWAISAYRSPIALAVGISKSRGNWIAELAWSGAVSDQIDIYREDELISAVDNTGSHTDLLGKPRDGSTFTYRVCTAHTLHCSKDVTVEVGTKVGR